MSTAVTTSFSAQLTGQLVSAAGGSLFSLQFPINLPTLLAQQTTTGTGANKADQFYIDQRTLATTVAERINLYSFGSGTKDAVGNAFTLANVKTLIIQNTSTTPGDYLTVGNDATSAEWTSFIGAAGVIGRVRGGGSLIITAPDASGYAVVNTTNHLLKILNSGAGSVTYNIIVIGATA